MFNHFVGLALKELNCLSCQSKYSKACIPVAVLEKALMMSCYSTRFLCKKSSKGSRTKSVLSSFTTLLNCNVTSTRFLIKRFAVNR